MNVEHELIRLVAALLSVEICGVRCQTPFHASRVIIGFFHRSAEAVFCYAALALRMSGDTVVGIVFPHKPCHAVCQRIDLAEAERRVAFQKLRDIHEAASMCVEEIDIAGVCL